MGTREESMPSKTLKSTSSTQDVPSTPYPDWSSSMQAYYGAGGTPTHFFPSSAASPSPHPYMWGAQHPMMPPYGTPVPYATMYPPGGVYAHPAMTMAPNSAPAITESVKDEASAKKSKGNSKGKGDGTEKAASGSGNDRSSQSDESATEGSSDRNNENVNQQEQVSSKKGSFKQMLADVQGSMPMKPVVPAANLNMGMDLWSSAPGGAAKISSAMVPAQDERELKRQKRKQSNRESARRSRLRKQQLPTSIKQAECEQLQQRVEGLTNENHGLREELQRLSEECEKLKTENNSIKDELSRLCGPEAVANQELTSMSGNGTKDDKR